ncbi:MAG: cyclic nucleotide-binding domain-containing protein [Bacteriovorax sp.]|nr:cyclic nucleotide-binding domain-containing protein [Bacteriovorax sp.]
MTIEIKKKVFLTISGNSERLALITDYVTNHYNKPTIYTAPNGNVGLLKIKNAVIDIVIIDSNNNTTDGLKIVEVILLENINPHMAIIIIGHPPEKERFLDELVTGKLYFIEEELIESEFSYFLAKALNFTSHTEAAPFYLRYLSAGEILIKEGDKAEFVYILKNGQLRAYNIINDQKIILGNIEIGEFVGEMSFINNEPRSAYIEAITDAQLIEVPIGMVDQILYKRPAWSKALMQTLSKRLKNANKILTQN